MIKSSTEGLKIGNPRHKKVYAEFISLMNAQKYATGGGKMYQSGVYEFLLWLEHIKFTSISKMKPGEVLAYYEYLKMRPNKRRGGLLSPLTISHFLFGLSLFLKMLLENGWIKKAIALPRYNRERGKQRASLSREEINILFENCQSKRDVAMLSAAYGCGLRRTEIEKLNLSDVQFSKAILIIREGKNHKRREVPMSKSVIQGLKTYVIEERHLYIPTVNKKPDREAFFLNSTGHRMRGNYHNQRLHQLVELTGRASLRRKEVTLHVLRHSIATHLLDKGAPIEFVRDFLGHSIIDTVHIYARRRKQKMYLANKLSAA